MNKLMYHEIVEAFENTTKRTDKIALLRKNADKNFVEFLQMAFHPEIQFDVEVPQYKPSKEPEGLNILYLHNEVQRMYRFIKNHPRRAEGLTAKKQKELLLQVLESLHSDEAELMVRCINKDMRIPFLTPKLLKETFPDVDFGVQVDEK